MDQHHRVYPRLVLAPRTGDFEPIAVADKIGEQAKAVSDHYLPVVEQKPNLEQDRPCLSPTVFVPRMGKILDSSRS